MSREIKFRAWHKAEQKMYPMFGTFLNLVYLASPGDLINLRATENTITVIDAAEVELMQFTGLLDETGREVYEGDIVRTENKDMAYTERSWEGAVTYQGDGYVIVQQDSDYTPRLKNYKIVSLEVIGNIYEQGKDAT